MVVVRESAPLVPVIVTVAMPVVAVLDAVKVTTLPAKLAVTPAGIPLALKATLPLKPPPGVTVIVLLADFPWATETLAGFAERVKSGPVTVSAIVAVCTRVPLVPTIEMFVAPVGVLDWAVKFTTMAPLPLTDEGLKLAFTPVGKPLAERETLPLKPKSEATVIVLVGFIPAAILMLAGDADTEKSGLPTTVRLKVVVLVIAPLVPVTVIIAGVAGTVALAAALNVSVLVPEPLAIEAGLKVAVTPVGKPLMLRATAALKLFTGRTVMDVVAVAPCITLVPVPKMLKLGVVSEGIAGKAFWMF